MVQSKISSIKVQGITHNIPPHSIASYLFWSNQRVVLFGGRSAKSTIIPALLLGPITLFYPQASK